MVSQLFPGADPDTSVTHQNFLATFEPNSEQKEEIARTMEFLRYVVAEEDYFTGNRIKNSQNWSEIPFYFGRNEEGGQRFHRWTDALLEAQSDEDLLLLYKKASADLLIVATTTHVAQNHYNKSVRGIVKVQPIYRTTG